MSSLSGTPSQRARVVVAIAIGITAAVLAYVHLTRFERSLGYDFTWPWRAARFLLAGANPYERIRASGDFPFDAGFKYPLPAALLAIPVAWCSAQAAAAVFGGVSSGLLAYGLTDRTWGRLFILLSPPYLITLIAGQWSTLLMAGALLPAISWVAVAKPTVGIATFLYRPNRWAVIGGAALLVMSFLALPSWLGDWLQVLRTEGLAHWYMAPIALTGGPLLLLALGRWRRPEARYLAAIAVVPHILSFYTGFLPMLVAETRREAQLLALSSVVAYAGLMIQLGDRSFAALAPVHAGYWLLWFIFFPALVMVWRRPNSGALPVVLERAVARAPQWIRGTPVAS